MKKLILVASVLSYALSASNVFASHVGENELTLVTRDLLAHVRQLQNAQSAERTHQVDAILEIIEKRKSMLLEMLNDRPDVAMKLLLPQEVLSGFPPEIKELLEAPFEGGGALEVLIFTDFKMRVSKTLYNLKDGDSRYELHFVKDPTSLLTGSIIRVRGIKIDSHLLMESGQVLAAGGTGTTTVVAAATSASGDQKTIVMQGSFTDKPAVFTNAAIEDFMFYSASSASINHFYNENSFGAVSFLGERNGGIGKVVGPFPINYALTGSCDYFGYQSALNAAATSAGIDLSPYTRRVYVVPHATSCGLWAGLAYMGGNSAWIFGNSGSSTFAHELGHNLGMDHASRVFLNPASTLSYGEYGDESDVMGSGSSLPHVNAPHKIQVGWIPSGRVQNLSAKGSYTYNISLLETTDGSALQAIKIPKANTSDSYYFSFRKPVGRDALQTLNFEPFLNRLSVHRWRGYWQTFQIYPYVLGDGESFKEGDSGITVIQVSHNATSAQVAVSITDPFCAKLAPTIERNSPFSTRRVTSLSTWISESPDP